MMTQQDFTATCVRDRAELLRAETHITHERLDTAIMAARPFESVENYGRILKVQYVFHRDVAPLYQNAELARFIPDLNLRGRLDAVIGDAAALGLTLPEDQAEQPCGDLGQPEALGWLYVVEGSNLGAAFLFKAALKMGLSAEHGASHLAEAPEGRAAQWRAFKAGLNAVPLSRADEDRTIAGATAAFERVRGLVEVYLK